MVGTTGFEPATSRTPSVRATRLRHVPTVIADERITCVRAGSRRRGVLHANRVEADDLFAGPVPASGARRAPAEALALALRLSHCDQPARRDACEPPQS